MRYLGDLMVGLAKWILDQVGRVANNVSATFLFIWGSFIGCIVLPVTWLLDWATQGIQHVTSVVQWISAQIDKLELDRFADLWAQMGVWLARAEVVFPLGFLFKCIGILIAIRLTVLGLRLFLRFIPFLK